MAKVIFTAWKTKAQLLDVRSEFYPPSLYNGPDMRSHACATVCEHSQITETSAQANGKTGGGVETTRQCPTSCGGHRVVDRRDSA
jgi:hypothetical protein